jgi:hypothetical protein
LQLSSTVAIDDMGNCKWKFVYPRISTKFITGSIALLVDYILAPEGIIRPVVSASVLTLFIRYIYYWDLHFLNNIIINKTNVLLPQLWLTVVDFGYPV